MTLSVEENFFTEDDIFGPDLGFMIAAGALESDWYTQINPTKGELIFYQIKWGYDDADVYYEQRDIIPSHRCTDEELGLVRTDNS